MMAKNLVIVLLLGLLTWFGAALVHVENQRYALELEMCGAWKHETSLERSNCLENVETRTGPVAHLLYGLGIL
jgi:hypothetical protein